jgi:hypothetical protein
MKQQQQEGHLGYWGLQQVPWLTQQQQQCWSRQRPRQQPCSG